MPERKLLKREDVVRMVVKCLIAVVLLPSAVMMYCCVRSGALADRHMEALTREKEQEAAGDG